MGYSHTQRAPTWFRLGILAYVAFIATTVAVVDRNRIATVATAAGMALIAIILTIFTRLTVSVVDGAVIAEFGWGWPRKRVDLGTARLATEVRNRWWYGWGIRLTPVGWLWNVWGLDAVEIQLDSGKAIRIGTDDTPGLLRAVGESIPTA